MICVLCGGVGAAKFLEGVSRLNIETCAVINTGDDQAFFGLHVSPDIDSIVYRLAGLSDLTRGWGRSEESFTVLSELELFYPKAWFSLGDKDLATHIWRTEQLNAGLSLAEVTAQQAAKLSIAMKLLPMSNQLAPTTIVAELEGRIEELALQEWFVKHQSQPKVQSVELPDPPEASPGLIEHLQQADKILIAPSNPYISIDPILNVAGVRKVLLERRDSVVAVSPIVGGDAVKGPAAKMMRDMQIEPNVMSIAVHYEDLVGRLVIDEIDRDHCTGVQDLGLEVKACDTLMRNSAVAKAVAETALS